MEQITTELDYNNGTGELPEGAFRISASSFSNFMNYPHQWYREKILGEEGFSGNTASVLGTCVHYCAEKVAKGETVDKVEIERYINTFRSNEDVDLYEVKSQYPLMAETLVNDYVLQNMPTQVEPFVKHEIAPGFFPSGSIDAIQGDNDSSMIIDYKTYNSKTKPKSIPLHYKYQLLIYAYICGENGTNIDRIRLVYINRNIDGGVSEKTGKPLKSYPPEVTVLTDQVTEEDIEFIKSLLNLCVDTVRLALEKPELAYMLFRDYRLKLDSPKQDSKQTKFN